MANNYNPSAAFDQMFLQKKAKENGADKIKKHPSTMKGVGVGGRPAKIEEEVIKRSYYLTQKHIDCLAKYCTESEDDLSSAVREAIELFCKKKGAWSIG